MMLNRDNTVATTRFPLALPTETVIVETRFGTYEFTPEQTVMMPQGPIGFPDHRLFGLGNLPPPVPEDFKLLQSFGEPPVSFIVMPAPAGEAPIEARHLIEACRSGGFDPTSAHVIFICTIQPKGTGGGIEMWANLRAPILLDLETQQARQYVLHDNRYPTRQRLDRWNGMT